METHLRSDFHFHCNAISGAQHDAEDQILMRLDALSSLFEEEQPYSLFNFSTLLK